jgi:hypothetical protein
MSALFTSYEQEVNALVTSLKARSSNVDERFAEDLREAEALVTQLDIEARASGATADVKARVGRLRDEIKTLRDRSALLGGAKRGETKQSSSSRYHEDEEALNRTAQVGFDDHVVKRH